MIKTNNENERLQYKTPKVKAFTVSFNRNILLEGSDPDGDGNYNPLSSDDSEQW